MNEKDFITSAIDKKTKKLKRVMPENMGLAGIIGLGSGYIVSEAYTGCMVNGAMIQIYMVAAFAALGLVFGYFDGKTKAEALQLDLMLLEKLMDGKRS